ncbi:MAG TPA: response regulator transcription factor [Atopostipes sp.]|nr:response regulator transcription factor [Atopostipes sp.]
MIKLNVQHLNDKKILLVDDEEDILNVLETVLVKEGFQNIYKAETGLIAIEQTRMLKPDIIVLDIMLPDIDGYEVCQEIRKMTDAPIIFLSAKSSEIDKLLGLGIGGDDYVTKPFSPKEVAYRIKAQFRRLLQMTQPMKEKSTTFQFGDIKINQINGEVKKADQVILLTALEYQLLLFFAQHPNQILSKEVIIEYLWGGYFDGNENALMVHIHHLRQKLETDPSSPKYIVTQRGLGYRLVVNNSYGI